MKKKRKQSAKADNWLDPQKTKKLLWIAGILVTLGILSLSLCVQYGLLTNEVGMNLGWGVLGVCCILMLIDTLAQDKSMRYVRLAGLVFLLVYVSFRLF